MDTELANWRLIAIKAAQWGADQELEACKQWLSLRGHAKLAIKLGYCMRNKPEPPSLKDQALQALDDTAYDLGASFHPVLYEQIDIIRRALEELDD